MDFQFPLKELFKKICLWKRSIKKSQTQRYFENTGVDIKGVSSYKIDYVKSLHAVLL